MFSYIYFSERKKEIYTERTLGMKLNQLISIFFIEMSILIAISIIIGCFIGLFLTELFSVIVFNPFQSYPPFLNLFPFNLILMTYGLIFLVALLLSVILAFYITNKDLINLFN